MRISADEVLIRPWYQDDNPLEVRYKQKNDPKTPYHLVRQKVSLAVSGQLHEIELFLGHLRKENIVSHASRFNIHPLDSERNSVVLEVEFWLLSLERSKKHLDVI